MTEFNVRYEAQQMLSRMGLSPTTLPAVMNNNAVPGKKLAKCYREVQRLLLENDLVEEVNPPDGRQLPGGWLLLRISDLGYRMVQERESIESYLWSISPESRAYDARRREGNLNVYEKQIAEWEAREARRKANPPPQWWDYGQGERLRDEYDKEKERPVFWAKYRLRRLYELEFEDGRDFPEKRWEAFLEWYFNLTSPRFRTFLWLAFFAGSIYVYFSFFS